MKIYKTNQKSIDKGILNELFPKLKCDFLIRKNNTISLMKNYKKIVEVKIDNRIKGYCLKEY